MGWLELEKLQARAFPMGGIVGAAVGTAWGFGETAALVRQLALAWAYNAGVVAFTVQLECQALFKLLPELGCRLSEFMHEYFKDRVYISYSPLALPGLSPTGFQSQLYGLIFPVLVPRAGMPNVELEPFAPLGRTIAPVTSFSACGLLCQGLGTD